MCYSNVRILISTFSVNLSLGELRRVGIREEPLENYGDGKDLDNRFGSLVGDSSQLDFCDRLYIVLARK